jgi:thiamine kinase-like enzyme
VLDEPPSVERLPGGNTTSPYRRGSTVVRQVSRANPIAHALLELLSQAGWTGAPRVLHLGEDNTETLSYLEGRVPWQKPTPTWAGTDTALATLSRLVRQFHDLTAGTEIAGSSEVVCHNDLAPKNTVYRLTSGAWSPYALIDWDLASPGRRIEDVAHICWQWLDLGPGVIDVNETARKIKLIATAYELEDARSLIDTIIWWQNRCHRGIEAQAATGDPAMKRLVDQRVPDRIRESESWTRRHKEILTPNTDPT